MSREYPRLRAIVEKSGDALALEELVNAESGMRSLQRLVGDVEDVITPDKSGRIAGLNQRSLALLRSDLSQGIGVIDNLRRIQQRDGEG